MNKPFFFQMSVKDVNTDSSGAVIIEGFASTPDVDRYRDIVEPSAFQKGLEMYMKNPALLRSHDTDRPAGSVLSAVVTDKGLRIRASVTEEETKQDVLEGRMRAFSIGYIPLETELQHEDGTPFNFETDSPWDADMIRVIKTLDLVEISIVTTPANGNALFTVAKSVKQFFNEVAMKSLNFAKKDGGEQVEPEKKPEADTSVQTTEEKPKAPEGGATDAGAVKEGEPNKEEDKPKDKDEAVKAPEDVEKVGATTTKDGGEGGVKPAEIPKAETKPESEIEKSKSEDVEVPAVDEETAKSLPELVEAGLLKMDVKAAQALVPGVKSLLRKLCDAYVAEAKRANDLQERLDKTPEKSALVVHGQFNTDESKATEKQKENSPYFKQLFKLN